MKNLTKRLFEMKTRESFNGSLKVEKHLTIQTIKTK